MPRENRKRGRTKKDAQTHELEQAPLQVTPIADVSEVAVQHVESRHDAPPPTWELGPDAKAYWMQLDTSIRQLGDVDRDEDRSLLLHSAVAELEGNELAVATDPDTSVVLERLLHVIDGDARGALLKCVVAEVSSLAKHKHASHVLQAMLAAASLHQEAVASSIAAMCEAFLPSVDVDILDSSASPVLRSLLLLANGYPIPTDQARSRKSMNWRANQGDLRRNKSHDNESLAQTITNVVNQAHLPSNVKEAGLLLLNRILHMWKANNGQGAREAAMNPITCPMLQIVTILEAKMQGEAVAGSLSDHILDGFLFASSQSNAVARSNFVEASLRDSTASHAIEVAIGVIDDSEFDAFVRTYFYGRFAKLTNHPITNFVVARVFQRIGSHHLTTACVELKSNIEEIIDNHRTKAIQVLADRALTLPDHQEQVLDLVLVGFGGVDDDGVSCIVPCVASLTRFDLFSKSRAFMQLKDLQKDVGDDVKYTPPECTMQGSLLIQTLFRFRTEHLKHFVNSLINMPVKALLYYATDPITSHVFDSFLESSTVLPQSRRLFLKRLLDHFHTLATDRIGSRVADRCWSVSDTYMREMMAKSVVPHQRQLQTSVYGHHFVRQLNVPLFERRREEWKTMQAQAVAKRRLVLNPQSVVSTESGVSNKRPASSNVTYPSKKRNWELNDRKPGRGQVKSSLNTNLDPIKSAVADVLGYDGMSEIRRLLHQ